MKQFRKPSELVKHIRKKTKLTQAKFGKIFKLSQVTVAKYENGVNIPPGNELLKIINYAIRKEIF